MSTSRLIAAALMSLSLVSTVHANGFTEGGKQIGQGFNQMGQTTGQVAKKSGKAVGKGFKKAGQDTGKAMKNMGKEVGQTFKSGG
jgi:hypothetical protein